MRADEFVRLCAFLNLKIYHFLTRSQAREIRTSKLRAAKELRLADEVRDMLKDMVSE